MHSAALALDVPPSVTGGGGGRVRPPQVEPSKQDIVAELMTRGAVLVNCDGRACEVPAHLAHSQLILRFGWALTPAIRDMKLDSWSISGIMTFGGVPHWCVLPWKHVYAAQVDGERSVVFWPSDQPAREEPDRSALEKALSELALKSEVPRGERGERGHLRLVD